MASYERKHRRQSIRVRGYDYTQTGAYFVTLCTHGRELLFGEIVDQAMVLNAFKSEAIRQEIELDGFVIMPNHLHGVVWIVERTDSVGTTRRSPLRGPSRVQGRSDERGAPRGPAPRSLGAFIGGCKSAATKRINQTRGTPGMPVWQRNYWEHVTRTERTLKAIPEYVEYNLAVRKPEAQKGNVKPDRTEAQDAEEDAVKPDAQRGRV